MKKFIVGLGCSWTQGEGGYPEHIWTQYNGSPQRALRYCDDYLIRQYEHENSWVNQLCVKHFPEYTPMNLGVKGIGNKAAIEQLYHCNRIDWQNDQVIVILMLSGFERLDLPATYSDTDNHDDGYSDGYYRHYKYNTAWPFDTNNLYWKAYAKELYSEKMTATNQMINLLHLQTFCKLHKAKLIVANAFNQRNEGVLNYLKNNTGHLYKQWDNSCYFHHSVDYCAMMEKLIELDGIIDRKHWGSYHDVYSKLTWPSKYITNCEGAHPTILGYEIIAAELAKYIKNKNYEK